MPLNKRGAADTPLGGCQASGSIHEDFTAAPSKRQPLKNAGFAPCCLLHALCLSVPLKATGKHSLLLRPSAGSWAGGRDGPGRMRSWDAHSPGSISPGLRGWGASLQGACPPSVARDFSQLCGQGQWSSTRPVLLLRKRLPLSMSYRGGRTGGRLTPQARA